MKKLLLKDSAGIVSHGLMLVVVLILVSGLGYRVYQSNNQVEDTPETSTQQTVDASNTQNEEAEETAPAETAQEEQEASSPTEATIETTPNPEQPISAQPPADTTTQNNQEETEQNTPQTSVGVDSRLNISFEYDPSAWSVGPSGSNSTSTFAQYSTQSGEIAIEHLASGNLVSLTNVTSSGSPVLLNEYMELSFSATSSFYDEGDVTLDYFTHAGRNWAAMNLFIPAEGFGSTTFATVINGEAKLFLMSSNSAQYQQNLNILSPIISAL